MTAPRPSERQTPENFRRELVIARAEMYSVDTEEQAAEFIEDRMRLAYALGLRDGYEKATKAAMQYQAQVQREKGRSG